MRSILSVFRFREAERIEEFLRHILSDDEISILRAIACFPLYRRLLDPETHSTTVSHDWMNKHQIAVLSDVSRKKIYHKHNSLIDLVADGFILEWKKHIWGGYRPYFRLNMEILLLQSYVRPFQNCFQKT